MDSYIKRLLAKRARRDAVELTWELHDALREKRDAGGRLTPTEMTVLDYVIVSTGDGEGIEYAMRESPGSIGATAKFAAGRGLPKTAKILADAAKGKPVGGPVSISAGTPGNMHELDVPMGEWGATDLALSLIDEDLDGAIMDFVAEHAADFELDAPVEVAKKESLAESTTRKAGTGSAVLLLDELLAHRKPRIRALLREDERRGKPTDWLDVAVQHVSFGPANSKVLAAARKQYGAAASDLLDIYERHDGCDLFMANGEPGFRMNPIADWPSHHFDVMDWARGVTWNDEPDEIPAWLETSIPFGWIPGDSERWILVTEGPHAGTVMLSDTDVLGDEPRFASIGELIASLHVDFKRVVGCGGFNSYGKNKSFYPEDYVFE